MTTDEVKSIIQTTGNAPIPIDYSTLDSMASHGSLAPGAKYLITDFATNQRFMDIPTGFVAAPYIAAFDFTGLIGSGYTIIQVLLDGASIVTLNIATGSTADIVAGLNAYFQDPVNGYSQTFRASLSTSTGIREWVVITSFAHNFSNMYYDDGMGNQVLIPQKAHEFDFFGDIEPIIVTASSTSSFEPTAISADFPQDVLYYNIRDNTGRACAPVSGGIPNSKGVIAYRQDTSARSYSLPAGGSNIDALYDWRGNTSFRPLSTYDISYVTYPITALTITVENAVYNLLPSGVIQNSVELAQFLRDNLTPTTQSHPIIDENGSQMLIWSKDYQIFGDILITDSNVATTYAFDFQAAGASFHVNVTGWDVGGTTNMLTGQFNNVEDLAVYLQTQVTGGDVVRYDLATSIIYVVSNSSDTYDNLTGLDNASNPFTLVDSFSSPYQFNLALILDPQIYYTFGNDIQFTDSTPPIPAVNGSQIDQTVNVHIGTPYTSLPFGVTPSATDIIFGDRAVDIFIGDSVSKGTIEYNVGNVKIEGENNGAIFYIKRGCYGILIEGESAYETTLGTGCYDIAIKYGNWNALTIPDNAYDWVIGNGVSGDIFGQALDFSLATIKPSRIESGFSNFEIETNVETMGGIDKTNFLWAGILKITEERQTITYSALVGTLNIGDTVTGTGTGATGDITYFNGTVFQVTVTSPSDFSGETAFTTSGGAAGVVDFVGPLNTLDLITSDILNHQTTIYPSLGINLDVNNAPVAGGNLNLHTTTITLLGDNGQSLVLEVARNNSTKLSEVLVSQPATAL